MDKIKKIISSEIIDEIAATEEDINNATTSGISWLAAQQNPDGSWGGSDRVGVTSLAVLKLEAYAVENTLSPLDPLYQYHEEVEKGLNYIFSQAQTIPITQQPAGNPDSSGDGLGVFFDGGNHENYHAGTALMAIAGSTLPNEIVNVPGSPVDGWTFKKVAQDEVDFLAWGQTDLGNGRGGWDYQHNDINAPVNSPNRTRRSDNSNSGWITLGLAFAEHPIYNFNCIIPQFVKDELNIWIDFIQNDVTGDSDDGGSGYFGPNPGPFNSVNILKTGNLLQQMQFYGDTADTQRVKDAIDYIIRHWNDPNIDPGWRGNPVIPPANYQATFTAMKGLESFEIDIIDGINWFEDISDVLVAQQKLDGSWPAGCIWGNSVLCTVWALLTLEKVTPPAIPIPPPPSQPHLTRGLVL